MTTYELVQLGTQLVNDAHASSIPMRLWGGVAIYARCPSAESNPRLQREHSDLDFIVAADTWNRVGEFFTSRGFTKNSETNARQKFSNEDVLVEVVPPQFQQDFEFDLIKRLTLIPLTLPLVDLLLIKLARINFTEKDIQDATALLVDHRVTNGGDEQEDINREALYQVTNTNYRLWKTVFDNTVTLEKIYDKYLDPGEAQLAWRRTELVQEVLDGKRHSIGWWAGRVLAR